MRYLNLNLNNGYAKFGAGVNKVHYGQCENGALWKCTWFLLQESTENNKSIQLRSYCLTEKNLNTVKPLLYGHGRDGAKCPYQRGVHIKEVTMTPLTVLSAQ